MELTPDKQREKRQREDLKEDHKEILGEREGRGKALHERAWTPW